MPCHPVEKFIVWTIPDERQGIEGPHALQYVKQEWCGSWVMRFKDEAQEGIELWVWP
jgi:hypothetical protein